MLEGMGKAGILIVEDEGIIATDLASRLIKLGYTICGSTRSGEEALQLIEQHRPDLVMMDISLAGDMDGIDAAETIREKWAIPVVFVTGGAGVDSLERAKLTYPFGYIFKPFKDRELEITVEMALYVAEVDARRRKAEDELRESEEKYRLLFTHAPAGIYEVDFISGRLVRVNSLMCEYTGYTEEELLNKGVLGLLTEESQKQFLARVERFCRGERSLPDPEYCMKNKDGSLRWIQLYNSYIYKNGRITGSAVVARDITERKRAEDALRRSEEKYRNLLESLDDIVWSTDLDLLVTYVSPSIEGLLEYAPEECMGRAVPAIMTPSSKALLVELIRDRISRYGEDRENPNRTVRVELECRHRNGSVLWFENVIRGVRDKKGSLVGIQGVSRDITAKRKAETARRESEEKYHAIFHNAPLGIFRSTVDGVLLEVNPTLAHMLGYEAPEEMIDNAYDIARQIQICGEDRPSTGEEDRIISGVTNHTSRYRRRDGTEFLATLYLKTIRDDSGHPLFIEGIVEDITERRLAEERIQTSLKEKETLLKELNHRVKNNMQAVISLMNLQARRTDDEQLKIAFRDSKNLIYAMSAVHESLLKSENLSRVDLGQYLTRLVETIFRSYQAGSGRIRVRTIIPNIDVSLEKSYPIGLVINELLSNALKYAFREGLGGEVAITGELIESTCQLVVADSGAGIPEGFDWEQADTLGLQMVRGLVEDQLMGAIFLDRARGTRWVIRFPV